MCGRQLLKTRLLFNTSFTNTAVFSMGAHGDGIVITLDPTRVTWCVLRLLLYFRFYTCSSPKSCLCSQKKAEPLMI